MEFLGAVILLLFLYLVYREWNWNKEKIEWGRERQNLLNRIQAPEHAWWQTQINEKSGDIQDIAPSNDEYGMVGRIVETDGDEAT